MQTLNEHTFLARRREPLLSYAIYLESKDSQDDCFDMVEAGLQQPAEVLQNIPPENFMTATRQRAWDGIDLLSLAYSAGHTTTDLRALYPTILDSQTSATYTARPVTFTRAMAARIPAT
ncbi:hypothetical protein ACQ4WQ_19970 [Janthinobacterium sp. GB1R12]|uniref:hypothetical protein n=1 Tax=Janthinobacterium sp. GB1R12 TaxID=3424190 RepID=UPI003F29BE81